MSKSPYDVIKKLDFPQNKALHVLWGVTTTKKLNSEILLILTALESKNYSMRASPYMKKKENQF